MERHVRMALVLVLLATAFALCACYSGSSSSTGSTGGSVSSGPAPASVAVSLKNFAFNPNNITVAVGGSVTFVNNDSTTHDIVGGNWDSGALAPGKSFTQAFTTAGTVPIHCSIHPSMTAQVTVK